MNSKRLYFSTLLLLSVFGIPLTLIATYRFVYETQVPTSNRFGWMNHSLDPITKKFLQDCEIKDKPIVLEIGAGTGTASLEALKRGAFVWVNDLQESHLADFPQETHNPEQENYRLVIGDFPDELDLPRNHFDSILAIRILHFFSPMKLERAISRMYEILKPGGKVFIVAATPFDETWQAFAPEYETMRKKGELYPGYIENTSRYHFQSPSIIPEQLHLLETNILQREFKKAGFHIVWTNFIQENDSFIKQFFSNRGLVGLIAQKPESAINK